MKILMFHNRYRSGAPSGEDTVFESEKRLLEDAGHSVVTYQRSNDEYREDRWSDRIAVARGLLTSRKVMRSIEHLIARERPDVAHFHNTFPLIGLSGYLACRRLGVPVVQTLHNYRWSCVAATHFRMGTSCELCSVRSQWRAVWHACYRSSRLGSLLVARLIRRNFDLALRGGLVDRYLALTQFARDRLVESGVPENRVVIKANFVDMSLVRPTELGDLRDRPYVVFSGRLSEEKGLRVLLSAWQSMAHVPLMILGDGPLRQELQRFAADRHLNVTFHGNLPRAEATRLVAGASCLVVPSLWFEGMPMVVLEAWALGVPVVGSRIGGVAELLENDVRGLSFNPGDLNEMRRQVLSVLSEESVRRRLIHAGFEAVRERSAKSSLQQLEATYQAVIRERGVLS